MESPKPGIILDSQKKLVLNINLEARGSLSREVLRAASPIFFGQDSGKENDGHERRKKKTDDNISSY